MAYIVPYKTWSTGETLDAENANGNLQNIITGLNSGTKDINVSSVEINGTPRINSSGNYIGDATGDVTGTVSDISNHSITDLTNDPAELVTDAGSGSITSSSERTNFGTAYTDTNDANSIGTASKIVKRDANGDFSCNYVESFNTRLAWGTFELDPSSPTMSNSYSMTSITYDGTGKFFAILPTAWMGFSVKGVSITDWLEEAGQITITELWDGTIREVMSYNIEVNDATDPTYPSSIIVKPRVAVFSAGTFSTATGITKSHYGTIHLNVFRMQPT